MRASAERRFASQPRSPPRHRAHARSAWQPDGGEVAGRDAYTPRNPKNPVAVNRHAVAACRCGSDGRRRRNRTPTRCRSSHAWHATATNWSSSAASLARPATTPQRPLLRRSERLMTVLRTSDARVQERRRRRSRRPGPSAVTAAGGHASRRTRRSPRRPPGRASLPAKRATGSSPGAIAAWGWPATGELRAYSKTPRHHPFGRGCKASVCKGRTGRRTRRARTPTA